MDNESFFISTLIKSKVTQGLGDDCVALSTHNAFATIEESSKNLVFGMDSFVENTHFKRPWFDYISLGSKAMSVNISDIVAKGATPKYALLSISLPKDISKHAISQIIKGIASKCNEYNIKIIGGDTISGTLLSFNIVIIGVKKNSIIHRNKIKNTDLLCFTSGKKDAFGKVINSLNDSIRYNTLAKGRFKDPILRSDFVYQIASKIHASMDITDGIHQELRRLSTLNHLSFDIFPRFRNDKRFYSGEEYELLLAFSPKDFLSISKIANKYRINLVPFARACKGRYRHKSKLWH